MKTTLSLVAALMAGALAGCTSPGTDDGDGGDGSTAQLTTPPPLGTALSASAIGDLVEAYDDRPFIGGQGTPEHVWKWVNEDVMIFLHFDARDPAEAENLNWIGVGVKGRFCKQDQDALGGKVSGFTHFHKQSASTWDAGHGGDATLGGDLGYWLQHVAVRDFTAPWGDVTPGTDYEFMPTDPPTCPSLPPLGQLEDTGEGPLARSEIDGLADLFDDGPELYQGGQPTPEHVWKWVNDETFLLLHFNKPDVAQADALLWYGVGVRGEFCAEEQPHEDFTHFHKWRSATWDGGHGGSPGDRGYWLLHAGVDTFEAPAWDVEPGVDREFMPTPPSEC